MSICTSILSKNHHKKVEKSLKDAKGLSFRELLPEREALNKRQEGRVLPFALSVIIIRAKVKMRPIRPN